MGEEDWDTPRAVRIPKGLWKEFGDAAKEDGTDRTTLIKRFMRAYLAGPRSKMPRRPKPPESPDSP